MLKIFYFYFNLKSYSTVDLLKILCNNLLLIKFETFKYLAKDESFYTLKYQTCIMFTHRNFVTFSMSMNSKSQIQTFPLVFKVFLTYENIHLVQLLHNFRSLQNRTFAWTWQTHLICPWNFFRGRKFLNDSPNAIVERRVSRIIYVLKPTFG